MVVTSLYTRNMLSTTLFPGYDNLVKPCHKLVSLYKVVTSCHKTLYKFETNCCKTCFFFFFCCCCCYQVPACDMHVAFLATGMQHVSGPVSTCNSTLCATCMLYVTCSCMHTVCYMRVVCYVQLHAHCVLHACCMLRACCMHVVYQSLIHVAICYALPYNYITFL